MGLTVLGMQSQALCSKAGTSRWEGAAENSCSPHGGQDSEGTVPGRMWGGAITDPKATPPRLTQTPQRGTPPTPGDLRATQCDSLVNCLPPWLSAHSPGSVYRQQHSHLPHGLVGYIVWQMLHRPFCIPQI